mgnify:CR=1 FL=1
MLHMKGGDVVQEEAPKPHTMRLKPSTLMRLREAELVVRLEQRGEQVTIDMVMNRLIDQFAKTNPIYEQVLKFGALASPRATS